MLKSLCFLFLLSNIYIYILFKELCLLITLFKFKIAKICKMYINLFFFLLLLFYYFAFDIYNILFYIIYYYIIFL